MLKRVNNSKQIEKSGCSVNDFCWMCNTSDYCLACDMSDFCVFSDT